MPKNRSHLLLIPALMLMLFAGLFGTKPDGFQMGLMPAAAATEDPVPPTTGTTLASSGASAPNPPAIVAPQNTWDGSPSSPNYDGRIGATMADRYAVYCKDGELQVWDGAENNKVAGIAFSRVAAMLSGSMLRIGEGVHLGRGENILVVVGPGEFVKDGLDVGACTGGSR
jgi:hypothetical protein